MRLRLEVLNALAHRSDGRATLDEVARAAGAFAPSASQTERLNRFPEIGEIDIFTSGLVFRDNGCLQITDAGRSLLHSLESADLPTGSPTSPGGAPPEQDGLDVHVMTAPETPDRIANSEINEPHLNAMNRLDAIRSADAGHVDHLVVVPSPDFRSTQHDPDRISQRRARFFTALKAKTRSIAGAWKGHVERDTSNPAPARAAGRMGAAIQTFLSFVALAACAAAVIALVQTKSLKTDIAMLDRELGSLSERLGKLEHAEKARLAMEQQEASQNKPVADKGKAGVEPRADQTALNLSREEILVVREYIKPAPATGEPAPTINVGDPVSGGTIPVPSSLTEKVPKLLGARFTTRNGSIIIVRRDSRQADAVLAPN